jgi:Domain of unknown function (DUF4123)
VTTRYSVLPVGDTATPTQTSIEQGIAHAAIVRLRAALSQSRTSTLSVLIDPMLGDPLAATRTVKDSLASGLASRQALAFIHHDLAPNKAPYLLHIPDELRAERCVNESVQVAVSEALGLYGGDYRGRSVCAWIVGESDPSALAVRLARAARVVKPDGASWPLRYWDPRVFWHLPRALDLQQQHTLIAQLGRWFWFDPTNAFGGLIHEVPKDAERAQAPLAFDESGWAVLSRVGAVNRVLGLAWNWDIRPTPANAKRVDVLIQRCHALGFLSEQDELVFSSCGLTSRDDFDSQPDVAEALRAGASRGISAMQALEPFDDDFWADLRAQSALPST